LAAAGAPPLAANVELLVIPITKTVAAMRRIFLNLVIIPLSLFVSELLVSATAE
jgi:hypothetical protein